MKPRYAALAVLFAAAMQGQPGPALELTYLGTAGWQITDGKTVILVDPYLTRFKYNTPNDPVSPDDPRPEVIRNLPVPSDTAVIDRHIQPADLILLTHDHPDHALDVPYIARKTGARIVGTESTGNLARAYDIPEAQIKVVKSGDTVDFPGGSVRAIASLHGMFRLPAAGAAARPVPVIPAGVKAPLRVGDYAEGGTLAYLIRIAGKRIVLFGSMNFIESELNGLKPDIAMIGAMPERKNIDDYTPRIMRALGNPPIVLPTHWDRFNVTYDVSQQPAVDRLQSFIDEVKAASPETRVIVPKYFEPIRIP
jgi:L-ascorbate metabolism protein UlaG (beta-lactamase superfamily)